MTDISDRNEGGGRHVVVVNQIGPAIGATFEAHPARPTVIADLSPAEPWRVPPEADVLLTRPHPSWRQAPKEPPPGWPHGLKWVQVTSAGVDIYPDWLKREVVMTTGRGVAAEPIAEYVLAVMLAREKRLDEISIHTPAPPYSADLGGLCGKTLGLFGYGAIGKEIARKASVFDMKVLAVRRSPWVEPDPLVTPADSPEDLFAQSDHLVVALATTPQTRQIVNADLLAHAKPGLHLVNIARGSLVDQDALVAALDSGRLGAASLDVTDPEPLPAGHRLLTHPRVRVTPHVSWSDHLFGSRLIGKFVANFDRYLSGEPFPDVVDPDRGY